jgi:hypothetical protein
MTEIETVKKEIRVLEAKLSLLEEMEKYKTSAEEAYKKTYGNYPMGEPFWIVFKKGYEAHQSLVDDANKIKEAAASVTNCILEGNPPNGCSAWSEWFELFGSKGILHNLKLTSIDYDGKDNIEEILDNPTTLPKSEMSEFRQKLFDGIESIFYNAAYKNTHWEMKVNMAVDEVLSHFYDVIPDKVYYSNHTSDMGWNDCIDAIKGGMEIDDDD